MKKYSIACECGKEVSFNRTEISDLDADWEKAVDEATADTRTEVEAEFEDCVDPGEIFGGRVLQELSLAVRRRDWREAELLIDRISDEIGPSAQEQVARGRFNLLVPA